MRRLPNFFNKFGDVAPLHHFHRFLNYSRRQQSSNQLLGEIQHKVVRCEGETSMISNERIFKGASRCSKDSIKSVENPLLSEESQFGRAIFVSFFEHFFEIIRACFADNCWSANENKFKLIVLWKNRLSFKVRTL